jgi:hypothetical protein
MLSVVHARQPLCGPRPWLFLAGPTPRSTEVESWRPAAITILEAMGFGGTVLVPEDADGTVHGDYTDQIDWEWDGIDAADVVAFWVPRELTSMPAFTTNVEFGLVARSGRAVFGAPSTAAKVRYLFATAARVGMPTADTLADTMSAAVRLCARRSIVAPPWDPARSVPCATSTDRDFVCASSADPATVTIWCPHDRARPVRTADPESFDDVDVSPGARQFLDGYMAARRAGGDG